MKKFTYPVFLIIFLTILLLIIIPNNAVFGSNTDWLNQHVTLAEHIRNTCYETHQLLPDYSFLGGGSNMFMFAYYGILRPDIIIGLLLPQVSMQTIIIAYAILGIYASMLLCYYWLYKQEYDSYICFICSLLFVCSTCFFQAHRQIMFINYMPFLLLFLIAIDNHNKHHKTIGMILSFSLILIHSFFFSISCFVVGLIYVYYKKASFKAFMVSIMLAIGFASILLIPTGLTILEHKKDAGVMDVSTLFGIQISFKSLLYHPYGAGVSCICLYSLLLGIKRPKTRVVATILFLILSFNICNYLLNGTLYIRGKSFIPFVPLLFLFVAMMLEELQKNKQWWNPTILIVLSVLTIFQNQPLLYGIDLLILISFFLLKYKLHTHWFHGLLCILPIVASLQANTNETFIRKNEKRQQRFTTEEMQAFYRDKNYRFDSINASLTNSNYTTDGTMKKSTMYASTMNTLYSSYFYDIMKTPISIQNRVALLANQNPFLLKMMSVRYLQTTKDALPAGYTIMQEKGNYVLAENKNVLPMAYATTHIMSEKQFDTLSFPNTLDTISNTAIVSQSPVSNYTSQWKEIPISFDFYQYFDENQILEKDGKTTISLEKETSFSIPLSTSLTNKIVLINFQVDNPKGKETKISINKIINKLSATTANYPNHHHDFTYMLSSDTTMDSLQVSVSKGQHTISNIKVYTLDIATIYQQQVTPLQYQESSNNEILKGTLTTDNDGYFITSLPYQNGYRAYVDGKEIPIEIVNKSFVGFPLTKGNHTIQITFNAPGKSFAFYISGGSLLIIIYIFYKERGIVYEK